VHGAELLGDPAPMSNGDAAASRLSTASAQKKDRLASRPSSYASDVRQAITFTAPYPLGATTQEKKISAPRVKIIFAEKI